MCVFDKYKARKKEKKLQTELYIDQKGFNQTNIDLFCLEANQFIHQNT